MNSTNLVWLSCATGELVGFLTQGCRSATMSAGGTFLGVHTKYINEVISSVQFKHLLVCHLTNPMNALQQVSTPDAFLSQPAFHPPELYLRADKSNVWRENQEICLFTRHMGDQSRVGLLGNDRHKIKRRFGFVWFVITVRTGVRSASGVHLRAKLGHVCSLML